MRIVWTASAVKQLNEIFEFYSAIGASSAGKGIVDQIVFEVEILKSKPRIGQKEELLHQRPEEFRYLLSGNYKIIYWIAKTELVIAMVFDSRQNPTKLKRLKS